MRAPSPVFSSPREIMTSHNMWLQDGSANGCRYMYDAFCRPSRIDILPRRKLRVSTRHTSNHNTVRRFFLYFLVQEDFLFHLIFQKYLNH